MKYLFKIFCVLNPYRLVHWGETLRISGIHEVVLVRVALEANMRDKKHLNKLKELTIESYLGAKFPGWLGHQSSCNLVSSTSPLQKLLLLAITGVATLPQKSLLIYGLNGVESIGPEVFGNGTCTFEPFRFFQIWASTKWRSGNSSYMDVGNK